MESAAPNGVAEDRCLDRDTENQNNELPISIAYCLDSGFLLQTAVSIASIQRATSKRCHIYLLHDDIPQRKRDVFMRACDGVFAHITIFWVEVPRRTASELPASRRYPRATFFRVLIAELLPAHVGRVIYLDGDTVVIEDIARLWNLTKHDDKHLAGCANARMPTIESRMRELTRSGHQLGPWRSLGPNHPYLNCGVLVINLVKWRQNAFPAIALDAYAAARGACPLNEQDAIHLARPSIQVISPRWNVQMGMPGAIRFMGLETTYGDHVGVPSEELLISPGIIHFAGDQPWAGFVPGRVGRPRTAEWFFWREMRIAPNIPLRVKIGFRVRMFFKGIIRWAKEMRYRSRLQQEEATARIAM